MFVKYEKAYLNSVHHCYHPDVDTEDGKYTLILMTQRTSMGNLPQMFEMRVPGWLSHEDVESWLKLTNVEK